MKYTTIAILLLSGIFCHAQEERKAVVTFEDAYKRTYHITRLDEEAPHIDGRLDEDIWTEKGEWSKKFSQVIPFERAHTSSWTRMKIFYDDKNIYIGVYCKDAFAEEMNACIGNRHDHSYGGLISRAVAPENASSAAPE